MLARRNFISMLGMLGAGTIYPKNKESNLGAAYAVKLVTSTYSYWHFRPI